jgi:hypothetical protein
MLEHQVLEPQGILELKPANVTEADVAALRRSVDGYLATHPYLNGVLVNTQGFPKWESLGAVIAYLGFVNDHHKRIKRVALATDMPITPQMESFVHDFLGVTAKRFSYAARDQALQWLQG